MRKSFRTDLGQRVSEILSGPNDAAEATSTLQKILRSISVGIPTVGNMSEDEHAELERLLAAILSVTRADQFARLPRDFKPRQIRASERTRLEKACSRLGLRGHWNDHLSMAETKSESIYVTEPYGLDSDDFEDFLKLRNEGWHVWIDDRVATYFPGYAVCVLLRPPKTK